MPILSSYLPFGSAYSGDWVVFGKVLDTVGTPISGATVYVYSESLDGTHTPLGHADVDSKDGAYNVSYAPDAIANSPKIIWITLVGATAPGQTVVSPSPKEQVDFKVGTVKVGGSGGVPETQKDPYFEEVKKRIGGAVASGSVLGGLDPLAVARLAVSVGLHPNDAAIARDAAASETLSGLPAALFFAAGRGGLPASVADLLKHSPADRQRAVQQSIANGDLSLADAGVAFGALPSLNALTLTSAGTAGALIATPGNALALAGVASGAPRNTILQAWIDHTGTVDDFWSTVSFDANPTLDAQKKAKAQFALHLDSLTRGNVPLMASLFTDHYASTTNSVEDSIRNLASILPSDWVTLATAHAPPSYLQADTASYAKAMFAAVEDRVPTAMLTARSTIGSGGNWFSTAIGTFVAHNPTYDLRGQSFRAFWPTANLTGLSAGDQTTLQAQVPALERLYRIAPRGARFEAMRVLYDAQIVSATQIQLMGRARFMASVGTDLATVGVDPVVLYKQAQITSAITITLQVNNGSSGPPLSTAVFPRRATDPFAGTTMPVTWEALFGGRTFCACDECQSTYGAPAYFADLLFWLHSRDSSLDVTGKILAKRPDLGVIGLSCKNTNTALPAIDLILEQLEAMLVPVNWADYQTTLDADELAARPEHVNTAAYERLAGKGEQPTFYPFDQPYVAALDQTRTFLKQLGVERSLALLAFVDGGIASALAPTTPAPTEQAEVAAEILGMTRASWAITSGLVSATTAARWGAESSLFLRAPGWTGTSGAAATVVSGVADPAGGSSAVTLTDGTSATLSAYVSTTRFSGGGVRASIFLKKDAAAANFVEVRLGVDGSFADPTRTFAVRLDTGATGGGSGLVFGTTESVGSDAWWKITATFGGITTASSFGIQVSPAAGAKTATPFPTNSGSQTGSATVYVEAALVAGKTLALADVATFLQRASTRSSEQELTYAGLEDLLCSQYVQEIGQLAIWFTDQTCDIEGATLVSTTLDAHLDRLATLIRLSHDLGWSVRDTDRAIMGLRGGATTVDESLLNSLATLKWLQRLLGLSVADLLDWWTPLDTRRWAERLRDGTPSAPGPWPSSGRGRIPNPTPNENPPRTADSAPFEKLARSLPNASLFALTPTGDALASSSPLATNLDAVAGLIGAKPSELTPLLGLISSWPGTTIDLSILSQLRRQIGICRALRISTEELVRWQERLAVPDYSQRFDAFATPHASLRFVLEVARNATLRLAPDAFEVVLGARNSRDLSRLGLPLAGDALVALADEWRAQNAITAPVLDASDLDEGNILPAGPWVGADPGVDPVMSPATDPLGGNTAVTVTASVNGGFAKLVSGSGKYAPGTPIGAIAWLRKESAPAYFAEIAVTYDNGATRAGRLGVDLRTGEWHDLYGFDDPPPADAPLISIRDAGGWWCLTFRHKGSPSGTTVGLIVVPAAGVADGKWVTAGHVGAATLYGARVAPVSADAVRDRAMIRRAASLVSVDVALMTGVLVSTRYASGISALDKLRSTVSTVAGWRDADPLTSADPTALMIRSPVDVSADTWELASLAAWMCRAFGFRAADLPWALGASSAARRGFSIEDVVLGDATGKPYGVAVRYAAWAALRDAARLQQVAQRPGFEGRLFDLFSAWTDTTGVQAVRDALVARTNWSAEDLAFAIGQSAFSGPIFAGVSSPTALDLTDTARFTRLVTWLELARALAVPAATLASWGALTWSTSGPELDPVDTYEAQAAQIEQSLRGAWGRERWLSDIPRVREDLRTRQRNGLLSRVVGDPLWPEFDSSLDVGDHLLMDVQLSPCGKTSRVKDAIRTVQVFVERALIGAEEGVRLTSAESQEWAWRKNYRVWQANRQVFLYPENWLRPELRTDKTPFFTELESELTQGDLRVELVEDAYVNYLRKLSDVSKLETLALYREEIGSSKVYHVFARTRSIPYAYWHRTQVGNRWTPWTELPKVEGEHLFPVVYQRRLMLFWLNITEASVSQTSNMSVPDTTKPPPQRFFSIRLSWSEFRDGKWSTPNKSDAVLGLDGQGNASGMPLVNFVSFGREPSARTFKAYSAAQIHGVAYVKDGEHDLLIELTREIEVGYDAGLPLDLYLGRFRFSAVDSRVSVETGRDDTSWVSPPRSGDRILWGLGQRFGRKPGAAAVSALNMPLPNPSVLGTSYVPLLDRITATSKDWIQIAPLSRGDFSLTDPFVFEDERGSYWALYAPVVPLQIAAFGGLAQYASSGDIKILPPGLRGAMQQDVSAPDSLADQFRNRFETATDGMFESNGAQVAAEIGGNIVAINGKTADTSPKTVGVTLNVTFMSSIGGVAYDIRAGSAAGADEMIRAQQTYDLPLVSDDISTTTEGTFNLTAPEPGWQFQTFFHPHIAAMRETLNRLGVFGLIDPPASAPPQLPEPLEGQDPTSTTRLSTRYHLHAVAEPPDNLDFSASGAYSQYNWELFFHAPFLVACRLHEAGKFDDALKWLKVIFDPYRSSEVGEEAGEAARSFWRFRPFREEFALGSTAPRNIQQLIALLTADGTNPTVLAEARDLLQQIDDWRAHPFDPHAIARTRMVTYMTAVVMKFLDVLIDYGDELFSRGTLESNGEATEYYLLAARILGARPEEIGVGDQPVAMTFSSLLTKFESGVGPAELIEENLRVEAWEVLESETPEEANSLATLLYFCTPANPNLAANYWDRVADRLFKIRNCLDIQGNKQTLALFEPPIDPDLLVRAAASGTDLQSALADIVTGQVPHRRYLAMADLAAGLAGGAQGFGQALLAAIEKRDGDQLNTLRNTHEQRLQRDVIQARIDQIADLEHQLEAVQSNRDAVAARLAFYKDRPRTNPAEDAQLGLAISAAALIAAGGATRLVASAVEVVPDFTFGVAGAMASPVTVTKVGGSTIGLPIGTIAGALEVGGGVVERVGSMVLTQSGYDRRKDEWNLQATLAQKDLDATDARIVSTQIQLAIANNALTTANLRLSQIDEIQSFLERRFARDELYDWMATQLSGLHYQSYQLAYEFAKKAEKAWQYELGRTDTFIQFGYWDSGRRGLLAADRLAHDLRRMQVAYSELSKRRLEIEQTFSMREIDPVALLRLQQANTTEFSLPEAFFDLYYPGHYRRRVRALRLTLQVDVPPNANVPLQVELDQHWIRKTDDLDSAGTHPPLPAALVEGGYGTLPATMMSTSAAQRDGGVFELNFNGPRLLPFEGAGAVSKWTFTLPKLAPFNYVDIQDVLLHVAYDADFSHALRGSLETGTTLLDGLAGAGAVQPRRRMISLRSEHEDVWRRIVDAAPKTAGTGAAVTASFKLTTGDLPAYLRSSPLSIDTPTVVLRGANAAPTGLKVTIGSTTATIALATPPWVVDGVNVDGVFAGPVGSGWPTSTSALATDVVVTISVANATDWGTFVLPSDVSAFDLLFSMELLKS